MLKKNSAKNGKEWEARNKTERGREIEKQIEREGESSQDGYSKPVSSRM